MNDVQVQSDVELTLPMLILKYQLYTSWFEFSFLDFKIDFMQSLISLPSTPFKKVLYRLSYIEQSSLKLITMIKVQVPELLQSSTFTFQYESSATHDHQLHRPSRTTQESFNKWVNINIFLAGLYTYTICNNVVQCCCLN